MCGGQGTRLAADVEKPLYEISGEPMIDRVLDALADSRIDRITCAVSPHTPATRQLLSARSVDVLDTPGDGYVEDLMVALDTLDRPVLTATSDLPLLSGEVIDDVLDRRPTGSTTVYVPTVVKRLLGVSVDLATDDDGRRVSPTGLNVVAETDSDARVLSHDIRLAVNVNEPDDARIAEAIACG